MTGELSIISRADANRLIADRSYRRDIFGRDDVDHEWLARIAGGYTPCSGPRRHHGCCSDPRPEFDGQTCVDLHNARNRDRAAGVQLDLFDGIDQDQPEHSPQCRAVQIEDGRYTGTCAFDPDNCDTCKREAAELDQAQP